MDKVKEFAIGKPEDGPLRTPDEIIEDICRMVCIVEDPAKELIKIDSVCKKLRDMHKVNDELRNRIVLPGK